MVVERREYRVRVMLRCREIAHIRQVGHAGEETDFPPVLPAILAHLDQTVVRADVEQILGKRRFGDGHEVAEDRGRSMAGDGLDGLDFSHHLQGVSIKAAGQIVTDSPPRIASVV